MKLPTKQPLLLVVSESESTCVRYQLTDQGGHLWKSASEQVLLYAPVVWVWVGWGGWVWVWGGVRSPSQCTNAVLNTYA